MLTSLILGEDQTKGAAGDWLADGFATLTAAGLTVANDYGYTFTQADARYFVGSTPAIPAGVTHLDDVAVVGYSDIVIAGGSVGSLEVAGNSALSAVGGSAEPFTHGGTNMRRTSTATISGGSVGKAYTNSIITISGGGSASVYVDGDPDSPYYPVTGTLADGSTFTSAISQASVGTLRLGGSVEATNLFTGGTIIHTFG